MTLFFLIVGCGYNEPVPAHPRFDQVRRAFLNQDRDAVRSALTPFQAPSDGLRGRVQRRWTETSRAAEALLVASKKSTACRAYAQLLLTCTRCHAGDALPAPPQTVSHGEIFRQVEEGTRVRDLSRQKWAAEALLGVSNLGPTRKRLIELTSRLSTLDSERGQQKFLGLLFDECFRCHTVTPRADLLDAPE